MITLIPLSPSLPESPSAVEGPTCYLLELDDVKILLDLGGYDPRSSLERNYEYEEKIRDLAPSISLLLLSHSPSSYLSLYPYARAHWGLQCPVYATQPTTEMGRIVCLEESLDWRAEREVIDQETTLPINGDELFEGAEPKQVDEDAAMVVEKGPLKGPFTCTPDQINEAFNHVKSIRYSQPIHLTGHLSHLLLTPFSSGHTLGGSLFKIRSPTSGTILYAVGMNHTMERHLDGTVLLGSRGAGMAEGLGRPDLLITEGGRSLVKGAKQKDRAQVLLELITNTLQSSHSLLVPVDPSPRLLELLILLDHHWSYQSSLETPGSMRYTTHQPWNYPLCLVSRTAGEMLGFARSLMEWFGGSVGEEGLEGGDDGGDDGGGRRGKRARDRRGGAREGKSPLAFRHLRFFPTPEAFMSTIPASQPSLVLAVPLSMSYGPSRRLFTSLASRTGNVLLLTGRSEASTLAQEMFDRWNAEQAENARWGAGKVGGACRLSGVVKVQVDRKVALEGEELAAFEEEERIEKEKEAAAKAKEERERSRRVLEADDLESESDSDEDEQDNPMLDQDGGDARLQITSGNAFLDGDDARTTSFDIYVKGAQTRNISFFRSGGGNAASGGRFRMFPFVERGGRGRKVDIYGELVDVGAWIRKGREIEDEVAVMGETEAVRAAKKRKLEEEEKAKIPPEPPSKFITEGVEVQLNCSVLYVDMEGLHDGRAIKTIIPQLNPRKIIIVNSSKASTSDLLTSLSALSGLTKDIFTPLAGETVTIGEHTNSWSLRLGETLIGAGGLGAEGAGWGKFEDYEVANITGRLALPSESAMPVLDVPKTHSAIGTDTKKSLAPTAISIASPAALPLPPSLYIGDLHLTSLRFRLHNQSIPAEFAGEGVLICGPGVPAALSGLESGVDEIVAVRKREGRVVVEGNMGVTYYAVRDVVYGSFAEVSM